MNLPATQRVRGEALLVQYPAIDDVATQHVLADLSGREFPTGLIDQQDLYVGPRDLNGPRPSSRPLETGLQSDPG